MNPGHPDVTGTSRLLVTCDVTSKADSEDRLRSQFPLSSFLEKG